MRLRASRPEPGAQYQMDTVERGTLTVTVTATGELKSLTEVKVGTEISGIVETVNVDYNTHVEVGQVLAKINTEKMEAQAAQARASLQSAQAGTCQRRPPWTTRDEAWSARRRCPTAPSCPEATGTRPKPRPGRPTRRVRAPWAGHRGQSVSHRNRSQEGAHPLAHQRHRPRPAGRSRADRGGRVPDADPVHAGRGPDPDEADRRRRRGRHRQRAPRPARDFRVDAYPDRTFESSVKEVRSTPKTSNGVVTYQTVLTVDNAERLLQPGMTATAEITVTQVCDAVLVPNAALRFTPPAALQNGRGVSAAADASRREA